MDTINDNSLNLKKIITNKWFAPIILIIIAISFSTYFRMMPSYLPITDRWAEQATTSYYRVEITKQINQQYPNLPLSAKQKIIEEQMHQIPEEKIKSQIPSLSAQYKQHFKNNDGDTYLLAIDPYLWLHYARNFVRYGAPGDKNVGGKSYDTLRGGRFDREENSRFHARVLATQYKLFHRFTGMSLTKSVFLFPVIFIGLSIIPLFFLTKRIIGNYGAFFASMIIALNVPLLSRTMGGFSDTDTYNILCPLFIFWFLVCAFYTKSKIKRVAFTALSGLFVYLYQAAWGGWYYIFDFILAMLAIYSIYLMFRHKEKLKKHILISSLFASFSLIFILLFSGFKIATNFIRGPLWVIGMKNVAENTIWPNVLTTVAEFGNPNVSTLLTLMGGTLFVLIALIGLVYTFNKDKRYFILMLIWFIGGAYAFTKGTRFSILLVPAFAIVFGVGAGYLFKLSLSFLKKINVDNDYYKAVMGILFLMLFVFPIKAANNQAMNEIPSMNDAWYDSLIAIKNDCKDGIITSWWDYGHWFYTIAERKVTFDGGDQGKRIYWVGKVLLTDNETEAIRILRMLNCGQNTYYEKLVDAGYSEKDAIDLINKEIDKGEKWCPDEDVLPQYFIASSDMVGKAGVWAHFGSWSFEKAQMWQDVRNGKTNGVSEENIYEILNTPADKWIAPWPSYGQKLDCRQNNSTITCNDLTINLNGLSVNNDQIRYIVYYVNESLKIAKPNPGGRFAILLSPKGVWITNQELAGSMFTRMYFFEGRGLDNFELLSHKQSLFGEDIYVYKVDLG